MNYLERSKTAWTRASEFPADKEAIYPMHRKVQEFDSIISKKVYEYGCGGGSDMMSYLRRGNHVTGSDIVSKNIEVAEQRILKAGFTPDQFTLVLLENSSPLPFPDNEFDVISSHGVLHHIRDVNPVIKELYRVCKPGGYIYVMLYSDVLWDHHWPDMERLIVTRQIDEYEAFCWMCDGEGTPYARCYTTEQACQFLTDVGFKIEDYNHWLNDYFLTVKGSKS